MHLSQPAISTNTTPEIKKLVDLAKMFLATNLALKPNKPILLVTVPEMLELEAVLWLSAIREFSDSLEFFCVHDMQHSGEEPPEELIKVANKAQLTILQTTHSLTHTQVGKQALFGGGRALSLPGADMELIKLALQTDYVALRALGTALEQKTQSWQNHAD